jgi:hypothetical protein
MESKNMIKIPTSKCLALSAALALTAMSSSAFAAATEWVRPQIVGFSNGRLLIQLPSPSAGDFVAWTSATPDTCVSQSLDTLKAWQSLAHSAMLSGKRIKINYSTCQSINFITNVWFGD